MRHALDRTIASPAPAYSQSTAQIGGCFWGRLGAIQTVRVRPVAGLQNPPGWPGAPCSLLACCMIPRKPVGQYEAHQSPVPELQFPLRLPFFSYSSFYRASSFLLSELHVSAIAAQPYRDAGGPSFSRVTNPLAHLPPPLSHRSTSTAWVAIRTSERDLSFLCVEADQAAFL